MTSLPHPDTSLPEDVDQLETLLSRPSPRLLETFATMEGDLIFLGVGGKMGPTMARMALRARQETGTRGQVIGVSRFRDPAVRQSFERFGIRTIAADLLDDEQVGRLPRAPYVVSMSGFKFGASERPALAWAANCYLPALVCRHYRDSRIVAFSTGNVYGLTPCTRGGSVETDPVNPVGEYAMTALGRERMYEYFSQLQQTPLVLLRLNYATELRYGVLVDLARQIAAGQEVDLAMSYVNVIWLADANALALRAFSDAAVPAQVFNLAGPEILSTRDICQKLAQRMGTKVRFVGCEHEDALLSNGQRGYQRWGRPEVSADQMLRWTADWIARGGATLDKPTHFQTRSGQF